MKHYYEEVKEESVDSTNYIDFEDEMHCIKGFIDGGADFKDYGEISPIKIGQVLDDIGYGYDKLSDISFNLPKKNGKKYSPKELGIVKNILKDDVRWWNHEDYCEMYQIIYGEEYGFYDLRGCCQCDFVTIYLPVKIATKDYLDFLETMFFNTGKEYIVSEDMLDSPEDFEDSFTCGYYVTSWCNPIDELAKQVGCKPEELCEVKKVYSYKYEEA